MPDTKTLATLVIFVVCALYILALFIIGIKFLYLRFNSENDGGDISRIHSNSSEASRNSLHELHVNPMQQRRAIEPPPSYSYAIDEPPPSYEDYEKYYKNESSSSSATGDKNYSKSQKQPDEIAINIELTSANSNESCSSQSHSNLQEQFLVYM